MRRRKEGKGRGGVEGQRERVWKWEGDIKQSEGGREGGREWEGWVGGEREGQRV